MSEADSWMFPALLVRAYALRLRATCLSTTDPELWGITREVGKTAPCLLAKYCPAKVLLSTVNDLPSCWGGFLFADDTKEAILQGGIGFELTRKLGCDGRNVRMVDTACAHTLVDGINHDGHTAWF